MQFDFTYYNPTKIYFGKEALENLDAELANYGKTVLLDMVRRPSRKSDFTIRS